MRILFLILAITFCSSAFALKIPSPPVEGTFTLNGDTYFSHKGGIAKIYPDATNKIPSSAKYTIPTSRGNFPLTLERKLPVGIGRLGKAAGTLMRKLGPVATALTIYEVVCDLSDLCTNPATGQIEFKTGSQPSVSPNTYNYFFDNHSSTSLPDACAYYYPLPNHQYKGSAEINGTAQCYFYYVPFGENKIGYVSFTVGCPAQYFQVNSERCDIKPEFLHTVYRPIVEQDWPVAEAKMNDPRLSIPILDSGGDLPVDDPVTDAKEQVISKTTETVRDETGTAIGTKTSETTVKVAPSLNPKELDVTEKSVVNVTNLTNNTSNTTTITNETPADLPPEQKDETSIEFDKIDDVPLTTYQIPSSAPSSSFGESTCLPDPIFSISKGTYTLPFHVACQFASMCRIIILLLSTLTAAFIITGTKNGTS